MDLEKPSETTEESTDSEVFTVPPYRVILHDDEITPMDFVVLAVTRFFIVDKGRAMEVMMEAHSSGSALVAIMPLEHAEFKVTGAHNLARVNQYPLTFTIEPCE